MSELANIRRLLIANRGEIAIRIARAAGELNIQTVAVFSEDDADCRHRLTADAAVQLPGAGPTAYRNIDSLIQIAREHNCDALHPGYGFLSESADFARACKAAGITFVGPDPASLALFGDKLKALAFAEEQKVPVAAGTRQPTAVNQARDFFAKLDAGKSMMIKALAGGGGRGTRIVNEAPELEEAFERCADESRAAFGNGDLYVEERIERARHIEVQIIGDGHGNVTHLGERECSLQRRRQKILEIAPAPALAESVRRDLIHAALRMAAACSFRGVGTFEFLVTPERFVFIEANPRLQVEHTVTEEISGVDLVHTQLLIADGKQLSELDLFTGDPDDPPRARGVALQLRINSERFQADGTVVASAGRIDAFESPSGPGVRVDSHAYAGYQVNPAFDTLLAKLVVSTPKDSVDAVFVRAARALGEFRLSGIDSNIDVLWSLLTKSEFAPEHWHTGLIDEQLERLLEPVQARAPSYFLEEARNTQDSNTAATVSSPPINIAPDAVAVRSPMPGRILELKVNAADPVAEGQALIILEAMKMEHVILAEGPGFIEHTAVKAGDLVREGQALLYFRPDAAASGGEAEDAAVDPSVIRADLQESLDRHAVNYDAARPRAVAKRHKRGQRTARENIEDLCDTGSFQEYGTLALAAQRRRRELKDLIKLSPADGLVAGLARINGSQFNVERARAAVMSYDYTVFAGTQGAMNHKKTDRLLHVVRDLSLPLVVFAEGGGGRPGDTDVAGVGGLDLSTFRDYAALSGLVPRIAVAAGRCFAGNAALLGCSDVVIATRDATIGMGGPVMIKGGGLGNFRAEEVGPAAMQARNGVVDVLVEDEVEAVKVTRQALAYFQGSLTEFQHGDQLLLRQGVPENRLRAYDVRAVIRNLCDTDSVLELRRDFAPGMITAFVRIGGRPLGLLANNPSYLAGAIDANGADKAARFMQLCDAFDIPLLSLCDTPGIMVGPEAEKTALVRHASRLFVTAASMSVPIFTIVLRKGYGLGAMAMAGGSFHAPVFTVAWPTGEFGAMGLEGAVETGFQKELAEIKDWTERQKLFDTLVAEAYAEGKAINMASYLEIDEVIDPADSRLWISRGLDALPPVPPRSGKKRSMVDPW